MPENSVKKTPKHAAPECQHPVTSMYQYVKATYDIDGESEEFITIVTCSDCGARVY